MFPDDGMFAIEPKVDDVAFAMGSHGDDQWIGGIENDVPLGMHRSRNNPLDLCQLLDGVDAAKPQVIPQTDVGHHADIASIDCNPFAKHSATSRLEYGSLNIGMQEYRAGALWPRAIS